VDRLKLAVISDEISQDFEHALKVIKELGAEYVEIRNLWGKNAVELSVEEVSRVKSLVRSYGLKISNIDSSAFKCYLGDAQARAVNLGILKKAIELSKSFDVGFTRIFSFWWQAGKYKLADVAEALKPAVELAEAEGFTLAVENEYGCYAATGFETRQLLNSLQSKAVKSLWDPGNAFFARENPWPDGYHFVKDDVIHVHLKDARVENDAFKWMPIGKGDIDFEGQIKDLLAKDIVVSLETHYVPPSHDREEGTKESFAGMLEVVKKVTKGRRRFQQ